MTSIRCSRSVPQLEIHTDVIASKPFFGSEDISAKPASAPARAAYPEISRADTVQMGDGSRPTRHESDISYSSSSDGPQSVMGPPIVPSKRERYLRSQVPSLRIASGGSRRRRSLERVRRLSGSCYVTVQSQGGTRSIEIPSPAATVKVGPIKLIAGHRYLSSEELQE